MTGMDQSRICFSSFFLLIFFSLNVFADQEVIASESNPSLNAFYKSVMIHSSVDGFKNQSEIGINSEKNSYIANTSTKDTYQWNLFDYRIFDYPDSLFSLPSIQLLLGTNFSPAVTGSVTPSSRTVGVTPVSIVGTATPNASVRCTETAPDGATAVYNTTANSSGSFTFGPYVIPQLGTYSCLLRDMSNGTQTTVNYSGSGDFSASVNTISRTVTAGQSASYTVTFTSISGFTGVINPAALNWSNVPASNASWSPSQVTVPSNGSVQTTFTINTSSSTTAGTYSNITLQGRNGSFIRNTASVSLTVNSQTVTLTGSVTPTSRIVGVTPVSIIGNATPNAGVRCTETAPDAATTIYNTTANSSGSYTFGPFVIPQLGTYSCLLRDLTSGQQTTINYSGSGDFSASVNVVTRTINRGEAASYTVTFSSVGGFSGQVNPAALNWSNVPASTGTWSVAPVTVPSNGSVQTTFTIQTSANTTAGTYSNITLQGKNGSFIRNAPAVSLTVNAPPPVLTWSVTPASRIVGVTPVSIVGNATAGATLTLNETAPDGTTKIYTTTVNSSGNYTFGPFVIPQLGTYNDTLRDSISGQQTTIQYSGSGDFSASVNTTNRTVTAGQSASYIVTFSSIGGFAGVVSPTALNWSSVPGSNASWTPQQVTVPSNGSAQATFTINTSQSTPANTYGNIVLRGTNGSVTQSASPVSLTVNSQPVPLSGSVTPASRIVGVTPVSIVGNATPNATVTLNETAPNGITTPYNTTANSSGSYTFGPFVIPQLGTYNGIIRDSVTGQTLPISYSGSGDFSASVNATSRTINAGQSASYIVTFSSIGGFAGQVNPTALNWSNVPNATATWSPQQVTVQSNGSAQATFTIQTSSSTPANTYGNIILRGTNGSVTQTASPVSLTVSSQPVQLTGSVTPSTRIVGVTPVSIVGTATPNATITLNETAPDGTTTPYNTTANSSGNYTFGPFVIPQLGTYNGIIRDSVTSQTLPITYSGSGSFTASVNVTSRTVNRGESASYTVTFSSVGGFAGQVNPAALNWSNVPASTGTWSASPVTVPSNGSVQTTFTIQTSANTTEGTYNNIILQGKNGSVIQSASPVSLIVNAPPTNFTGSLTPPTRIVGVTPVSIVGTATPGATITETETAPDGTPNGPYTTTANSSGNYAFGTFVIPQLGTYNGTIRDSISGQQIPIQYSGSGDFSASVNTTSQTVTAGQSASYTVTFSSIGGFAGVVNLAALNWSNVPGSNALWSPQQVTVPSNGSAQATFTINTIASTAVNTYGNIILQGKNGSFIRNASPVSLTVNAPNQAPTISNITSPIPINQTTNLIVNGTGFQNGLTAAVITPSGTFQIAAAGVTFVNSNQLRVQVTMQGTPPYTATLRITNPNNQSATGQFQVVSTTNPAPSITSISPSQIPINQPRVLTVFGRNFRPDFRVRVQGFEIAPTGLTFVNSNEVRVQVTMGGTPPYSASLVLTNSDGQTATGNFNVNNNPPDTNAPTASFTFTPNYPNVNQSVQFTSTATGQSLSYAWDFESDGIVDSNSANPTYTFSTTGSRNVTLRVSNTYGVDSITRDLNVGTTNTSAPIITNVFRTFPGLFFLRNTDFDNYFDVRVNWNGAPGRVRFQVNNNAPFEVQGTSLGVCQAFNLQSAFSPSWSPSNIRITPINSQGVAGDTSLQTIYIFPYPGWLDDAVTELGESIIDRSAIDAQNNCSSNLLALPPNGMVKTEIRYKFPAPPLSPFKARLDNVPSVIPYFGNNPLGIRNVEADVYAKVYSNGVGEVRLRGQGGFEAMGKRLDNLFAEGFGETNYDSRGLFVKEAGFNFGLTGTLVEKTGIIRAVPALSPYSNWVGFKQLNEVAQVKLTLKPKISFGSSWSQDQATRRFKWNGGLGRLGADMQLAIEVPGGRYFNVETYGGGGLDFVLGVPSPYLREAKLNFEVGVRAKFIAYELSASSVYTCDWLYTRPEVNCRLGAFAPDMVNPGVSSNTLQLIDNNFRRFGNYEEFHSEGEKTHQIERKTNSGTPLSVDESIVINNLYPDAEPVILPVGSSRVLIWVRQNPNLPVQQSTEIAWSYNDGASWTSPSVIISDTRAEFSPVAGVDKNGKVVIAWLRVKDQAFSTPIENLNDLPLFFKQVEVVTATFDPSTRIWSPETVITNDSAFDTSLRLSSDSNGNLLLTWQSNPNGEFVSDISNPASLKYTFWNGSNWNTPNVIASDLVNAGDHAAAVRDNNAFIIVPRDRDTSISNDRRLDLYTWNGSVWSQASTFAGGNIDNLLPTVTYDSAGQGQVIWLRGTNLVQATLNNINPNILRQGSNSMGFYSARLLNNTQGNLTLVWQEVSNNGPANIYAMLYDTSSQTWSEDLQLNDNDWASKSLSAYYGTDGKLRMAFLATQILLSTKTVTVEGQTVEIPNVPENGQTDLRLLEHSLINDLVVTDTDLALSPQFPRAGESVTANLKLRNSGDFSLNNFNIKIYAGNPSSGGTLLSTTRIIQQLVAGESRTVSLSFTNPQTPRNIVAVIDADNEINEFAEDNNRATVYFENIPPVAIATANVTSGNSPLAINFNASSSYDSDGDALSFAWSFADGSPSAAGASVSHTFEQTGLYPVIVSVTDARGAVSTATVIVSVNCKAVTITPATLPNGSIATAYSQNLSATGGVAPYSFVVTSGASPTGLTLAANGLLSGTPTESGTFYFTTTATYANGCPGTKDYTIVINQSRQKNFDFDGDGKSDISVFRPDNGAWYISHSQAGFTGLNFGYPTDKLTPADFDGDGKTDVAVFRDGNWFYLRSIDNQFRAINWGLAGDIPVPGDYDGDGKADAAVFRQGYWYILNSSNNQFRAVQFGLASDKPVPADFDGDGKTDVAVFRDGNWYWLQSSDNAFRGVQFGIATDKPVVADYDGDGKADPAVFRDGVWYLLCSQAGFIGVQFGIPTDIPVAADYDGDGKADIAVFRDGNWYRLNSSNSQFIAVQFGIPIDKPIPAAFVP